MKTKKINTWQSKLTKKELKHLRVVGGVTTLSEAERTFRQQAEDRKRFPGMEPCWGCKAIARKLGFEV